MKKLLLLLFLFTGLTMASHAQTSATDTSAKEPPLLFSIGLDVGKALSPTNATYSSATGVSLKLEIPFQDPHMFFTITAGYSSYGVKNTPTTDTLQNGHFVPLLIGFKYIVIKHVFLEADFGDSYNINQNYLGYQSGFTYSPVVGVSIPLNKPNSFVDISAYYQSRLSGAGNINQAAIRVAYKFGL